MPGIYKQWAIGGIDAILHALWAASQAVDVPIPYEPYLSPFASPAGANERTARLMGSFQLPALAGAAAEPGFIGSDEVVPESRAAFGQAATNDYRSTFHAAHPELKGKVIVHHGVEQQVLSRFPKVVTEEEIHSLENLRGIPKDANANLHLRQIRHEWDRFYDGFARTGTVPTKAQLLNKATEIDRKLGSMFMPPVGGR